MPPLNILKWSPVQVFESLNSSWNYRLDSREIEAHNKPYDFLKARSIPIEWIYLHCNQASLLQSYKLQKTELTTICVALFEK
jgi:hypothetical protein